MNWRVTAFLFVIIILLASILFLVRQSTTGTDTVLQPSATPQTLLIKDVTINDVVRLDIFNLDADQFVSFARNSNGEWVQNISKASDIENNIIDSRVVGLINLSSLAVLHSADRGKLSDFGLENPKSEIVLVALDNDQYVRHAFHIGSETATENGIYVLKQGDPRIHVVPNPAVWNILALLEEVSSQ